MNNYNITTQGQKSSIISHLFEVFGFGIGNNIFKFNLATFY